MAKEMCNGRTPPASRMSGITPSTRCAGSDDASSTAMRYTRIPNGAWNEHWNKPYYPANGPTTTYGHSDKAKNGNTGHRLLMSSKGGDDAKASTNHADMEEASAILGNDARIATRPEKRKRQEFDGVCGKAYSARHALRRHVTEHRDDKAYIRKARNQRSVQKPKFVRHYQKRAGEQLYKCETCGKSFRQLGNVKIHQRRHTGEKPYACKTCGKAFAQQGHLNVHQRKHTGERPYCCNTCGKSFTQMANLDVHKRTHTGEKRHVSAKRAKSFKSKQRQNDHSNLLEDTKALICETCNQSFLYESSLRRHRRSHADETSRKFAQCGIRSRDQSPNDHSNLHKDTKAFICETCNQSFLYESSLRRHRRSHADETSRKFAQCGIRSRDKVTLDKRMCQKVMCCLCGDYFPDTDQLAAHLVAHAGGRP